MLDLKPGIEIARGVILIIGVLSFAAASALDWLLNGEGRTRQARLFLILNLWVDDDDLTPLGKRYRRWGRGLIAIALLSFLTHCSLGGMAT